MNINRDYLIINDVKKSNVKLDNGSIFFYITDKNTQNIFVNLVINVSKNDLIQKFANIENAEDYTLTMNIVKPDNTYKVVEGKLHDKENAIFEFDLNEDCCDKVGTYKCELLTKCNINDHEEITTSNRLTYKVKSSVLNDLDDIVEVPEYPLVIQLFDKLSDIEQYEEDRRANELARQLAEEQRQARFDTLDADMTDRIETIDNKLVEIDNVLISKEDIADIKSKNAEQDRRLDVAENRLDNINTNIENVLQPTVQRVDAIEVISATQNDRLDTVEAKNTQQDNRLDIAENRLANIGNDITNTMQPIIDGHTSRLEAIEAIDVSQNNRLDAIEAKNTEQDNRLLDIEKVNNRQDIDIKCLYRASQTIDVAKEGNSIYLQNSNNGFTIVDEIKGNTLVNCNKEPDKELILNGNINTSGNNTVIITEGVDGGLVDVALEGNTLVNVSKTKGSTALPLEEELTYLYANTQYTVQFNSDKVVTADIILGGTQLLAQNIVAGLNRITITTPSELVDNKLVISGVGANISEVVVTDTDREFGYFEGMKSVGEGEDLEVKSVNKNLYNLTENDWINYGYFKPDDSLAQSQGYYYTPSYIDVSALRGKRVYIHLEDGGYTKVVAYNTNKKQIAFFATGGASDIVIDLPINTNFIRLSTGGTAYRQNTNMICKEGDRTYIAHQSNTQQLTHEPLRAVGNVKDKYTLIDGKWYIERKCGKVTVDDMFLKGGYTFSEYNTISFVINLKAGNLYEKNTKIKCNAIKASDNRNYSTYVDYDYITLWKDQTAFCVGQIRGLSTLDDVQQYFIDNNVVIIYPLATPTYEEIDYNPLEVYSDTTHITTNSVIPTNITVKNHGYNCLLKPSTTYTISSNLGLNTVTTPSTLTEDCLRFMDTDTSDVTTMKNVLVLEGDWTSKANLIPSNFSGMESAFEQEYDVEKGKYKVNTKIIGKNLYDINKLYKGYTITTEGSLVTASNPMLATIKLDVSNLQGHTLVKSGGNKGYYRIEDNKNNFITGGNSRTITIPTGSSILYWYVSTNKDDQIQIEIGNSATEYEPYQGENNITFYINEPLRGVGDAKDRVYAKDDKVVVERNCASVTLDGSDDEDWKNMATSNGSYRFVINSPLDMKHPSSDSGIPTIINNTLNSVTCTDTWYNIEGIGSHSSGLFVVYKKLINNKETLKQWLQQNPTTIVYQLAEPTYEEVEYNDVKLFIESFKNSTLSYNSNVPVTSKLYYSYSVPIVDTVAQTANVTDQQDSMIIDLATQCAVMEMMLM